MRLLNITAQPYPEGNRIDIQWENPAPDQYPGVRVVRREGTFPTSPTDGVVVAEALGPNVVSDESLRAETVYYYTLFPYKGAPPEYDIDPDNRTVAMATGQYNLAGQMYDLLPAIYHRYDTVLPANPPPEMSEEDKQKGQLRRFLDVVGSQLDQFYSFAKAALDLHSVEKVDGRLLPLLAEWIGWQVNRSLDFNAQRHEIRHAPHIYRTVGTLANLRALINRLTNWDCQIKEFHYNVFRSNAAPALAIWMQQKTAAGWQAAQPFVRDTAFAGAPAVLRTSDGTLWLFYHAQRGNLSAIWCKTYSEEQWQPAKRLTDGKGIHKHPAIILAKNVLNQETIYLYWCAWENGIWQLKTAQSSLDGWSVPKTILPSNFSEVEPAAFAERGIWGARWLFWSSPREGCWQIWHSQYRRLFPSPEWRWATPKKLTSGLVDDRKPTAVIFNNQVWVFWSRQTEMGRRIFYSIKPDLDFDAANWSNPQELMAGTETYDEAEPHALVDPDGSLHLYWRSNKTGADNIWHREFINDWQAEEQITQEVDTCQGPAAIHLPDRQICLWYRSAKSVEFVSPTYPQAKILDHRYAGATTVDTRNRARLGRRGQYEDNLTYIYDTRRGQTNWYARDTLGIYLTPNSEDQELQQRVEAILQGLLPRFLPVSVRAVLIINPPAYSEEFYPKDHDIEETYENWYEALAEERFDLLDAYKDKLPTWRWFRSWSEATPNSYIVDTQAAELNLQARLFFRGIAEGDDP